MINKSTLLIAIKGTTELLISVNFKQSVFGYYYVNHMQYMIGIQSCQMCLIAV